MGKLRYKHNKAVSPVVGTTMMVAIMLITSAIVWGWGVPMINDEVARTEAGRASSELGVFKDSLESQAFGTPGSTFSGQISNGDKGSVTINSEGNRLVPYYSVAGDFDFSVTGLDDGDNEFDVNLDDGTCSKAVIHWDIDSTSIESTSINDPVVEVSPNPTNDPDETNPGVILNGRLIDSGLIDGSCECCFQYTTDASDFINQNGPAIMETDKQVKRDGEGFNEDLYLIEDNLVMGVEYYYRAKADNGYKVNYSHTGRVDYPFFELQKEDTPDPGDTGELTVEAKNPIFVDRLGSYCKTKLSGNLLSFSTGETSAEVYCGYSTSSGSLPSDYTQTNKVSTNSLGDFRTETIDLGFYTTYYCRAFAKDSTGEVMSSNEIQFTTPGPQDPTYDAPSIQTLGATTTSDDCGCGGSGQATVELEGNIINLGDEDYVTWYFEHTCTDGTGICETTHKTADSSGPVSAGITVECGKNYGYCLVVLCPNDGNTKIYGDPGLYIAPSVDCNEHAVKTLGAQVWATQKEVDFNGRITEMGDNNEVTAWFLYRLKDGTGQFVDGVSWKTTNSVTKTQTGLVCITAPYSDSSVRYVECKIVGVGDQTTYEVEGEVITGGSDWTPGIRTLQPLNSYPNGFKLNGRVVDLDGWGCTSDLGFKLRYQDGSYEILDGADIDPNPVCEAYSGYFDYTKYDSSAAEGWYDYFAFMEVGEGDNAVYKEGDVVEFLYGSGNDAPPTAETAYATVHPDNTVSLHGKITYCGKVDGAEHIKTCGYVQWRPKGSSDWGPRYGGSHCVWCYGGYTQEYIYKTPVLTSGITYEFRAVVKHADYGWDAMHYDNDDPKEFTTAGSAPAPPQVTCNGCGDPAQTSVDLYGILTDKGGCIDGTDCEAKCYFEIREEGSSSSWPENDGDVSSTAPYSWTTTADGLSPGTTYEYRPVAKNLDTGLTGTVAWGACGTFTTDSQCTAPNIAYYQSSCGHFKAKVTHFYGQPSADVYFKFRCGTNCACFLPGTAIAMADGSYKNIEDVKIGDKVKSYDELNGVVVIDEVVDVYEHPPEENTEYYLIINDLLYVTPNHNVSINGEWKQLYDLKIGDKLKNIDGNNVIVDSVRKVYDQVTTYNLEIKDNRKYFAEKILVHNWGKTDCNFISPWTKSGTATPSEPVVENTRSSFPCSAGAGYEFNAKAVNDCGSDEMGWKGTYYCSGSLLEGTHVSLPESSCGCSPDYKNIEDIEIGDIVKTYDFENNAASYGEVTAAWSHEVDNYLVINNRLQVTPNHIVNVNNVWTEAANIKIGDSLIDETGDNIIVTSIGKKYGSVIVYDITVDGDNNYYADGILVHNIDTGPGGQSVDKPEVFTTGATIKGEVAILEGYLNDIGSATDGVTVYFEYGESETLLTSSTTPQTMNNKGGFKQETDVLSPGAYVYRAVAVGAGTDYGDPKPLTMVGGVSDLEVLTKPYDPTSDGGVILNGELTDLGGRDYANTYFAWDYTPGGLQGFGNGFPLSGDPFYLDSPDTYTSITKYLPDGDYYYKAYVKAKPISSSSGPQEEIDQQNTVESNPPDGMDTSAACRQTFTAGQSLNCTKAVISLKTSDSEAVQGMSIAGSAQSSESYDLGSSYLAQKYLASNSGTLSKISLRLKGAFSSMTVKFIEYDAVGGDLSGTYLSSATLQSFVSEEFTWLDVVFPDSIPIVSGRNYAIKLDSIGGGHCFWDISVSNVANANAFSSTDDVNWITMLSIDFMFKTYVFTESYTPEDITVTLIDITGAGVELDSTTISGFFSDVFVEKTATFSSTPTLISGNIYAIQVSATGSYYYTWESSGYNVYAGGSLETYSAGGFGWMAQPDDFLFKTYVETESGGTTNGNMEEDFDYAEGAIEPIHVSSSSSGDSNPNEYDAASTDQVITFDPAVSAGSSVTIQGFAPIGPTDCSDPNDASCGYNAGYDDTQDRNFVVSASDGKKGICIDLFDSSSGRDVLKGRIWIFNQGNIKWSSSVGYSVLNEGGGIIKQTPGSNAFLQEGPLFIKSDNTLTLSIVQLQPGSTVSKSGGSSTKITAKLQQTVARDIRNFDSSNSFKIRVHGDTSSTLETYLKGQGFQEESITVFNSPNTDDEKQLVFAPSTGTSTFTLHHSIFQCNLY